MKICKQCGVEKPLFEYYRYANGYLYGKCKECCILQVRKNRDPEKQREYNEKYRNSIKGREYNKKWWKIQGKELDRKRNSLPDRKKFYRDREKRRWNDDTEYYRLKRRARGLGTAVGIIAQVFVRDKVCCLCGSDKDLQIDHIFPQSLGGKGKLENLQLLCKKCNSFKSNNLFLPGGGIMIVPADLKCRMVGEGANLHPES